MAKVELNPWLLRWGKRVENHPNFWKGLGRLESAILSDQLEEIQIDRPIYVTGMARSGSTILLEILDQHKETKSFAYRDFPFVDIPWFWSQILKYSDKEEEPVERAHQDRIKVTPKSPEAMEEILWMQHFPHLHKEDVSQLKDELSSAKEFSTYYTQTIKKLLLSYNSSRYLSKGNYNITRIKYLLSLFPDARFVIPIRHPLSHIKSCLKQHTLFLKEEESNPDIAEHLHREGHFEFGFGRKPINAGDKEDSKKISHYFQEGNDLLGYAYQWKVIYGHVIELLKEEKYRESLLVVKYEDLCMNTEEVLEKLFTHVGLEHPKEIIAAYSDKLTLPDYYNQNYQPEEQEIVQSIAKDVAKYFGY